jgi:WD40 repeat protein
VVWDLGTQTIVRTVDYAYDDYPSAVLPGDWAGPMWTASDMERKTDGGTEYVVTLTDVAQSGSAKVQVLVPDPVDLLAFSPDGKSLMVGLETGEVSMWDVSDKTKMVKPVAPLYAEGTGWLRGVYSAAFTSDSAYMAIGTETGEQFVVRLASFGSKISLESAVDYAATAVAFAPDNLALVIGEHSDSKGLVLYCKP